jgi:tRNA modification GTPase
LTGKTLENQSLFPQTIFAPATGAGRAGLAVLRISGPAAREALLRLCPGRPLPAPRRAALRALHHPKTGETLDRALIIWFPAPHSFTGEDVAELHIHGGRAVLQGVLEALGALPDFRLAEPGEFTRRAFENGRMDLTEAEAVADLVHAETEAQRRQALRQMEGALGNLYGGWRARLARSLAYMEAAIDFADEDLPPDVAERQVGDLQKLQSEIADHLNDNHRGERLREGFSIAILGPPNAGKSSLLNMLARRDAAIVSSTAGTTRDVIEVHLDLGGYPVLLADTAGLRGSADAIENEGVRRALARAEQADLKLIVFDGAIWPDTDEATFHLIDDNSMIVVNKSDQVKNRWFIVQGIGEPLFISALTGEGLPELLAQLTEEIKTRLSAISDAPSLTRARHREALGECRNHIARALKATQGELRAEDMRLALRALGRITGHVGVEDLLDIIFRDFCIGK